MDSNYKTRVTSEKEDAVGTLATELSSYDSYIFTDYRGLTVEQITNLRKDLKKDEAEYRVVKNRYAKLAFKNISKSVGDEQLKGPTAVALVKGDTANTVAASLYALIKDGASLSVKGALIGDEFMPSEKVEALSKLPGKLALISALMGTMKAPVQKLAATLLAYSKAKAEDTK